MARKSKSIKKRFYGVNTNELALVFSIAITLFVAGVMGGGVQLTTRSDARMPKVTPKVTAVEGQVRVCGRCRSRKAAEGQAGLICAAGMDCVISPNHEGSGENPSFCKCKEKKRVGGYGNRSEYTNTDCYTLDHGGSVVIPKATGVPGYPDTSSRTVKSTDNCWR